MLISNWTCNCLPAVIHVLQSIGIITFLSGQIGSNEHDDMERLSQGLCAYLLGNLIIGNDNSVSNYTQEELMQLIEKRIGIEIFLDKLSEVSKHEAYNRALKHPQIKCLKPGDLILDHSFCQLFKVSFIMEIINYFICYGGFSKQASQIIFCLFGELSLNFGDF